MTNVVQLKRREPKCHERIDAFFDANPQRNYMLELDIDGCLIAVQREGTNARLLPPTYDDLEVEPIRFHGLSINAPYRWRVRSQAALIERYRIASGWAQECMAEMLLYFWLGEDCAEDNGGWLGDTSAPAWAKAAFKMADACDAKVRAVQS